MLMEIEDFNNNNNNNTDRSSSSRASLVSKFKNSDLIPKVNDNRYFVQRDFNDQTAKKLSPPKMKRRMKDIMNEQNNTRNSQTTDLSKKALPEVHKDCNCGTPKGRKGSSSSSSKPHSTPLRSTESDPIRSSSKLRDDLHKCSPNKNLLKQIKTEFQNQQQKSKSDSSKQPVDDEPIHMSWDEVMQEAKMLGIPLKTQSKQSIEVRHDHEMTRSGSGRSRKGRNFYSDGDDCNRFIGQSRQDMTSVASSASSIGMRHLDQKKNERSPQTFRGMIKLQNFFKKLELRHKSPCHCQSVRNENYKTKRHSSPRSFLKEILMPQKNRTHEIDSHGKFISKSQNNSSRWECEECIKQCKYCRSIEKTTLANMSRNAIEEDEDCSISMTRSWQPETSFDQLSLPLKSSSLNRNLKHISYQESCYSLSSRAQQTNFSSFNTGLVSAESDISPPDSKKVERSPQDIKQPKHPVDKKSSYEVNPHESLKELKSYLWYWGSLGREGSNEVLRGREDGCFLVRNSSDDRYVLALSFRSQGVTHHTGIEYSNGQYTFHERSPPIQSTSHHPEFETPKENVMRFIERASNLSKSDSDRYYLQPRSNEEAVVPVKLWTPILRPVELLKNLVTDVIVRSLRRPDFIANLPVTSTIKRQVKKRFQTKVVK